MTLAPILVATLLVLQEPAPPTTLNYVPPKDSRPADIEKAAKALAKRLTDFGYKDVTAKTSGTKEAPEIVVASAGGITPKMRPWINHFATLAASKVEIAFEYEMKDPEIQQYEAGKSAPHGATWSRVIQNPAYVNIGRDGQYHSSVAEDWKLFRNTPRIIATGNLKWVAGANARESHFELSGAPVKAFKDISKATMFGMQIAIDGLATVSNGAELRFPNDKTVEIYWASPDKHIGPCINNPMPFALSEKK